jgi:hypothetical protein
MLLVSMRGGRRGTMKKIQFLWGRIHIQQLSLLYTEGNDSAMTWLSSGF